MYYNDPYSDYVHDNFYVDNYQQSSNPPQTNANRFYLRGFRPNFRNYHPPVYRNRNFNTIHGVHNNNVQRPAIDRHRMPRSQRRVMRSYCQRQNSTFSTPANVRRHRRGLAMNHCNIQQSSSFYTKVDSKIDDLNRTTQRQNSSTNHLLVSKNFNPDNSRDTYIDELRNQTYQCPICLTSIKAIASVWSCSTCFFIYHLHCIKSWAQRSTDATLWYCPSCRTEYNKGLDVWQYRCFCGRQINPKYDPSSSSIPHGCDQICGKIKGASQVKLLGQEGVPDSMDRSRCIHTCTELCHPGPCPPCLSIVSAQCPCGKLSRLVPCTDQTIQSCGERCSRQLSAIVKVDGSATDVGCALGLHLCTRTCHFGPCQMCVWIIRTSCFCGSVSKDFACGNKEALKLKCSSDDLDLIRNALSNYSNFLNLSQQMNEALCSNDESRVAEVDQSNDAQLPHLATSPFDNLSETPDDDVKVEEIGQSNDAQLPHLATSPFDDLSETPDDDFKVEEIGQGLSSSMSHLSILPNPAIDLFVMTKANVCDEAGGSRIIDDRPLIEIGASFSCDKVCAALLGCKQHYCAELCHRGACEPCKLDPKRCLTCACGKVPLHKLVQSGDIHGNRTSCTDPILTCPNVCGRPNALCGHKCPQTCHPGLCPPCELTIQVQCRCGHANKEMTCRELAHSIDDQGVAQYLCGRVCKKRKRCSRHKCDKICCDDSDHPCSDTCGRLLACKSHNCEDPCHAGPCSSCWRGVIYSPLYCRCGLSVLEPPQPCGTVGPTCDQLCNRVHDCDHPVKHTCHNDPTCPPCTVLMTRDCVGGHGVQFHLPCFQSLRSCGQFCLKKLSQCSHLCLRDCHSGSCLDSSTPTCTQLCQIPRPDCKHPCGLQCHQSSRLSCIQAAQSHSLPPCKVLIDLVCPCGKFKLQEPCHEVQSRQLANFMSDLSKQPLSVLSCTKFCAQTREPMKTSQFADTSTWKRGGVMKVGEDAGTPFETPEYSDELQKFALKHAEFVLKVEKQLESLVMEFIKRASVATNSNELDQQPRVLTHYFGVMKPKYRQFIHNIVEFYGMQAFSFDREPNRRVMVLAKWGCAKMPGCAMDLRGSLSMVVNKDLNKIVDNNQPISAETSKNPQILPKSHVISQVSYAQALKDDRG